MTNPSKIGRYEIIERVGRGGMGVLYRGRDTVLDREVAIKVMSAEFDADSDDTARPRFYREARAAAKLQHRNIVTIFEFGEEGSTPFIVMEFLRGEDLSRRMRREPALTLEEKLDIVADLCTGLHFAHEQGVVHRDVKPANIWLQPDGSIKLLDFGIAKVTSSTMTRQGSVFGSVSYMSPEQVSGGEVDGRADVFAAGVVLYELLTGKRPFDADSPTAVIARIMDDAPASLDRLGPEVPKPLANALAKALQKDKEQRYRHAADFGADLRLMRSAIAANEPMTIDIEMTRAMASDPGTTIKADAPHAEPAGAVRLMTGESPPSVSAQPAVRPTWLVPAVAAAAVLVVVVGGAFLFRSGAQPAADPKPGIAAGGGTPSGGATAGGVAPAGAATAGATTAEKRAVVPVQRSGRVAPSGAAGVDPRNGRPSPPPSVAAAPAAVEVVLTGSYAFDVYADGRALSTSASEHRVRVPAGAVVKLRASDVFLNRNYPVDGSSRHIRAPELGRLNLRIPEVCTASIDGQDLGEPPYQEMPIAEGSHSIRMACRDGESRNVPIYITKGELTLQRLLAR